ncbi:MAG TPA: hypothetical protein VGK39_03060 [Cyclobacteriaceae bacterium]
MNRILLPDFYTTVYTTTELIDKYWAFWQGLGKLNPKLTVQEEDNNPQRCAGMLWRMKPLFDDTELVLCRDADSVITYREANCIHHWLRSGLPFHAINDNDAHGGLMGGLVGFKSKDFLKATNYKSFDQMVKGLDLKQHGSDQNFLNKSIHPKIKHGLMMHKLRGAGVNAARVELSAPNGVVDKKYWVTDLISRYIGSAGVIDFELLRFFKSFDNDPKFDDFEKLFPNLFYWNAMR